MIMKYWNSMTSKDRLHEIKFSQPYSVLKDFQGPGQMDTSFMEVWPPCIYGYSSFAVLSA